MRPVSRTSLTLPLFLVGSVLLLLGGPQFSGKSLFAHAATTDSLHRELQIAVLLPFNTELIEYDSLNLPVGKVPQASLLALNYYEGMMMALDSLRHRGMRITVHVYDTYSDTARIQALFEKKEVQKADFILGPVYGDELRVAASLAKHYKVPLFSPVVATTSVATDNPYYFVCNASLRTHCRTLYDFILKEYHPAKIFLLYREGAEQEVNIARYFSQLEKEMEQVKKTSRQLIPVSEKTNPGYFQVDSLFNPDTTADNIVIIPSPDEYFVNTMVKNLKGLSGRFHIVLFGLPKWRYFSSLDNDDLELLHTCISSTSWKPREDSLCERFDSLFQARWTNQSSEFAYAGYDFMLFAGQQFLHNGKTFYRHLENYTGAGLANRYRFEPVLNPGTDTSHQRMFDCYENQQLNILRYENGTLLPVQH